MSPMNIHFRRFIQFLLIDTFLVASIVGSVRRSTHQQPKHALRMLRILLSRLPSTRV